MDEEETQKHGHVASMDLDDKTIRKEAMLISSTLGIAVAVITFGLIGWAQRKTFKETTVTFDGASSVTIIEED